MMAAPHRLRAATLATACALACATALPGVAEAQVRRNDRGAPQVDSRRSVQVGNQARVGSGNTHVGGNVNIGNEINVGGARRPGAIIVPVYPGYDSGPSTGEIIAAGVIAGATAGLVAGAMQQPSTTVVTTAPATTGVSLEVGTRLSALPSGCVTQQVSQKTYYRCGSAWLLGVMDGAQLVYLVVPTPG